MMMMMMMIKCFLSSRCCCCCCCGRGRQSRSFAPSPFSGQRRRSTEWDTATGLHQWMAHSTVRASIRFESINRASPPTIAGLAARVIKIDRMRLSDTTPRKVGVRRGRLEWRDSGMTDSARNVNVNFIRGFTVGCVAYNHEASLLLF